jgi:hypothetical protein
MGIKVVELHPYTYLDKYIVGGHYIVGIRKGYDSFIRVLCSRIQTHGDQVAIHQRLVNSAPLWRFQVPP